MIEKIANREDIGNILANGVVEASKEIGKGPKNTLIIYKNLNRSLTLLIRNGISSAKELDRLGLQDIRMKLEQKRLL
jgi:aldehyde:ferredoxin oxidoreductase